MVSATEKEVRFTRSRQALLWMVLGTCGTLAIFLGLLTALLPRPWGAPEVQEHWWALVPLLVWSFFCYKLAFRCLKHAYLIFSPVGIEIFPFRKPDQKLDVVMWAQIDHIDIKNGYLFLHFDVEETSGKAISLSPIAQKRRPLIERIVEMRSKLEENLPK